ncbi:MAG: 6-carboxytetrahydropterin synthase [Legionellales bacterium]|nr:6-carboxytetrahydropterin synthase [Legionellales bacterium]
MKITCKRRFHWSMGHRLLDHEGECKHLHGHNYVAIVYAEAEELDHLGRVIDFGILKKRIGDWIATHWDHAFTRSKHDHLMAEILKIANSKEHVMPYNPTAENLARYLLTDVCPLVLVDTTVTVTKVVIWETENCSAECELN